MTERATIYDVARHAEVSPATVSRVFSDDGEQLVARATRQKVLDAARKLHFTTNRLAAGLRRGRTDAISLVMPFNTPELMDAFQQAANAHQYTLMVQCTFQPDVPAELRALTMALEHQVAGLVWQPVGQPEDYASILPRLKASGTAVVMLERGETVLPEADLVHHDTDGAARAAVDHLGSAGYGKLLFAHEGDGYVLRDVRSRQFVAAAGQAGRVLACPTRCTREAIEPLLEKSNTPLGIYADGDWTAMAIAEAAEACGVAVGPELGILTLGDMLIGNRYRVGEMTRPTLSALQRDQQTVVRTCMQWLLERIDPAGNSPKPRRLAVPTRLVQRQSTCREATARPSRPDEASRPHSNRT